MRVLKNLVIDEVACVLRGANAGAKVLIRKAENDVIDGVDIIDPNDTPTALHPQLQHMVNAMIQAVPSLKQEHALFFLLHSPHGRALARHLSEVTKAKEHSMPQVDILKLRNIESVAEISKAIIKGDTGMDEHTFAQILMGHARTAKRANESDAAAFSRVFTDPANIEIRRAHALTKSFPNVMSVEPVSVETGSTLVTDDSATAADQLRTLVEQQRARAPTLTTSQLFERVYADPANKAVVARAHRRSSTSGDELQR
jgi:hypothetical protein